MKKITALILLMVICIGMICSCNKDDVNKDDENVEKMGTGACTYLYDRDITNRRVHYVEFCVEGYGRMVVLLDETTAPKTVAQFLALISIKFYDGLTFHRIEPELVIQGGCPNANGTGGIKTTLEGEFESNGHSNDIRHRKGVIAMARGDDPDSASCQFYFCNDNSYELDGDYATFGYVVEGLSVIDDITAGALQYADPSNYYTISDKSLQPVIKYIKLLDGWTPSK